MKRVKILIKCGRGRGDCMALIEWVKQNLSDILSISGIALTLLFSAGAKKSANAAKLAAENTRIHLKKVEVVSALQDCLYMAQNLLDRVDKEEWEIIGNVAADIKLRLISIRHSSEGSPDEDRASRIQEAIVEFGLITGRCDKFRFGSDSAQPVSKPRMLASIRRQIENIAEAQESAKRKLGEANVSNP